MPSHSINDINNIEPSAEIDNESLLNAQIEIVNLISARASLPYILETIVNVISSHSRGGLIACMMLVDSSSNKLVVGAAPAWPEAYKTKTYELSTESPWGKAIITKNTVIIDDMNSDPMWRLYKEQTLKFDIGTCISLPLINHANIVLGVLIFYTRESKKIVRTDMLLVNLMKGLTLLAIEGHSVKGSQNEVPDTIQELKETRYLLQQSNAELQQFAYVANHDLQEPLRKIKSFGTMLTESEGLTEKDQLYLNKIVSAAERMSKIINGILNFTKLGRKDERFIDTDLNQIFENIIDEYAEEIKINHVTIEKVTLPVIKAVPLHMNLLFSNLMSNALKFSKKETSLNITISLSTPGKQEVESHELLKSYTAYCKIIFRDNGIGFDPKFTGQIFDLFRRLNDRSYSGAGIGLALCKRIVNYHGGVIFADSEEHVGTQINIILPVHK